MEKEEGMHIFRNLLNNLVNKMIEGRPSSLEHHALREFKFMGWMDERGKFKDKNQERICKHVLKLIQVFSKEMHSGSSAQYVLKMFMDLASFLPLGYLTGEDWEWRDVTEENGGEVLYQNIRCPRIFKGKDGAWDIEGRVFVEKVEDTETKTPSYVSYTSNESFTPISFPYFPFTEYVHVK